MDHVPLPRVPKYNHVEAPVYCTQIKDWQVTTSLKDFPARRNWSFQLLHDGDYDQGKNTSKETLQAFLQEWLYFRLIQSVFAEFNLEVDLDDLVRQTSTRKLVLDSRCFARYFSALEGNYRNFTRPEKIRALRNAQDHLQVAIFFIYRNCSLVADCRQRDKLWPFDETDNLAFITLGSTLTWSIRRISDVDPDTSMADAENLFTLRYTAWGVSKLIFDRMVGDGWCLNLMAQLVSGESSVMGMYFASFLTFGAPKVTHSDCSAKSCQVATIDESKYQTSHICPSGACHAVAPVMTKIWNILKEGQFPILHVIGNIDERLELDATPFRPGTRFVAISHVWADGLGNTDDNSLPHCQVVRLIKFVQGLYPFSSHGSSIAFWIDTICVPRQQPDGALDYRRLAIDKLRMVYENADKVLVLDSALLTFSSYAAPEELLIRIRLCGWMRRLWTLQEGMLGPKVRFQLMDRALDPEDLLSSIMPEHHQSIWFECYGFFQDLNSSWFKRSHPSIALAKLWNALQWRQTSHDTDETICLGVLADLDLSQITSMPKNHRLKIERMKNFYEQYNTIPSHIVFMPGPRIEEPGFNWAPDSFMARHRWTPWDLFQPNLIPAASVHTLDIRCLPGQVQAGGLRCKFRSLLIDTMPKSLNMIFYVHTPKYIFVAVYIAETHSVRGWDDLEHEKFHHPTFLLPQWPEKESSTLAILVAEDWLSESSPNNTSSSLTSKPLSERATIADHTHTIGVRYICRFHISRVDKALPSSAKADCTLDPNTDTWKPQHVPGELCDHRYWCIG